MLVINLDPETPPDPWPNYREIDGLPVVTEEQALDGETWVGVLGFAGTEWVRLIDGHVNGNPHVVNTYGWDGGSSYPNLERPLDWNDDIEPKWCGAVPYTYHGFDFTEYDVDYTEEYDTFEEAVKAGKELSKLHAKSA